jgi:lipopolysaccharide/colanic/teichoic acid biosynthesis glycosyltransferase
MITKSRYGKARASRTQIRATESVIAATAKHVRERADAYSSVGKRLFDILFSLSVLILFSPVYMAIGLLIFMSSPGPILYVQKRVGRNGRSFGCR